jgi:hypothetical protein
MVTVTGNLRRHPLFPSLHYDQEVDEEDNEVGQQRGAPGNAPGARGDWKPHRWVQPFEPREA